MHDTESTTTENLEREIFALGVQLAAARERLALALRVVDAARAPVLRGYLDLQDALAAFDAVPGDEKRGPSV